MTTIRSHLFGTIPKNNYRYDSIIESHVGRKLDQVDMVLNKDLVDLKLKKEVAAFVKSLREYTDLLLKGRRQQRRAHFKKTQEENTLVYKHYHIANELLDALITSNRKENALELRVNAINTFSAKIAEISAPKKTNAIISAAKNVLYYAAHFIGGNVLGFIPGFLVGFKSVSATQPFAPMLTGAALGLLVGGIVGVSATIWAHYKQRHPSPPEYAKTSNHFFDKKDAYTLKAQQVIDIAKRIPIVYKPT